MIGTLLRVRYELTQLLSENAVFRTFAASDKVQGREVSIRIIKEPFCGDKEFVASLKEVVRRVSAVRHANIEDLFEVDSDEQATFIVGRLTKGSSLSERLRKLATFSVPASVEAAIAICEGLGALNRAGMAHGDIGSHSAVMQTDGELRLQCPCLWEAYACNQQVEDATVAAMAPYLAPEISRGGKPTPTSDVYSVGILLFELLTGRQPYRADNPIGMAVRHASDAVPNSKGLNPSIPQTLDFIVQKAMAKDTENRYRDAAELLADLRVLQDALRFGKTLSWPLRPEAAASAAVAVAPESSASKVTPKPAPTPRTPRRAKDRNETDVPLWLTVPTAFMGGIVAVMAIYFVYLNLSRSKAVPVPELKHLTVAEAAASLKRVGLTLQTKRTEANEQVPAGSIISTDPPAGGTAFEGSPVGVIVSGGSRFIEVPDLRGVTVDKARLILTSVGLILDEHVEQVRDKNLDVGLIVSQVPPPREKHERQTKVRVRVSSGKGSSRGTVDPNADTKYVYRIRIRLTDIDQSVLLRVDMTDNRGTKTVHEERHEPNDDVEVSAEGYGSEVNFRIFYDGDLVLQKTVKADEADQTDESDNKP